MARRWPGWLMCLCLMWALAGSGRAEEIWLRYRFSANVDREIVNTDQQMVKFNNTAPNGWKLPDGVYKPLAGEVKMAGDRDENKFRVVFAAGAKGGKRDRMWISRDGDWSKAATYKSVMKDSMFGNATCFTPVLMKLKTADGEVDYHAQFILLESRDKKTTQTSVVVKSSCLYEDQIELEGKKHRVALVDNTGNGRFNDSGQRMSDCDWLMVDANDDGRLDAYGPDYKEVFTVGKYMQFGEKLYALTVAPDGASFSIEPAKCQTGKIRLKSEAPEFKAVIFGENGRLNMNGHSGEVSAPCGQYKLVSAQFLEAGKSEQDGWRLTSRSMGKSEATTITVAADKTAEVVIGPPLKAELGVEKNGAQYSIVLKMTGQAGEEYTVGKGYGGSDTPAKLEVKLKGSSEPPKTYSFEYG